MHAKNDLFYCKNNTLNQMQNIGLVHVNVNNWYIPVWLIQMIEVQVTGTVVVVDQNVVNPSDDHWMTLSMLVAAAAAAAAAGVGRNSDLTTIDAAADVAMVAVAAATAQKSAAR